MINLESPYLDFLNRAKDIYRIVCAIEACSKSNIPVRSHRADAGTELIGALTATSANSMAVVYLASCFEDFVRQEIGECMGEIFTKYASLSDPKKHKIRNLYWEATRRKIGFLRSILTKTEPKQLDPIALSTVKRVLDGAQLFVVQDAIASIDIETAVYHANNMRPDVINELGDRIGVNKIVRKMASQSPLMNFLGASNISDATSLFTSKLDQFYIRRNEIVHSLGSSAGIGVDQVRADIQMLEATAEALKTYLESYIKSM